MPLLFALLASWATAADFPACVVKSKKGVVEPATLKALLACQEGKRAGFKGDAEALGELQRAEVRDYLARHPERASTDEGAEAKPAPAAAKQKARAKAAAKANAARLPEEERAGYEGLGEKLWGMSGDGQLGVTPAMAGEIARYLQKQQGGVSAEMSDLLGALQKDGAKLSDGSVRRLKKAARDAKAEGLDLGLEDERMEGWLLDPATDPEPDGSGPAVN